eukprot:6190217-Pleurochrysis_carterae.AAC.3
MHLIGRYAFYVLPVTTDAENHDLYGAPRHAGRSPGLWLARRPDWARHRGRGAVGAHPPLFTSLRAHHVAAMMCADVHFVASGAVGWVDTMPNPSACDAGRLRRAARLRSPPPWPAERT